MNIWEFADRSPFIFLIALLLVSFFLSNMASQFGRKEDSKLFIIIKLLLLLAPYIIKYFNQKQAKK